MKNFTELRYFVLKSLEIFIITTAASKADKKSMSPRKLFFPAIKLSDSVNMPQTAIKSHRLSLSTLEQDGFG